MAAGHSMATRREALPAPPPHNFAKFHIGVNLPWVRYGCDFGANAWQPRGGMGLAENHSRLHKVLAEIRARDALLLRWFLLCDGRAGIRFEKDGTPAGLDDCFFADVDAALAAVHEHGLRVVWVLLDFQWCHRARRVDGVAIGGHRSVLRDLRQREALFANVLEPALARYGKHPAIAAWDVMNEPEHATLGAGAWSPLHAVSRETMRSFLLQTVARIHGHTQHAATVGLASLRGLPLCRDTGLDFYQVHWYDKLEPRSPLATKISSLELDRPLVLGEFPTVNSKLSVGEIIRTARAAGYGGAWCWSALAEDKFSAGSLPILRV